MASVESRVKELAADDEPGPGDTVFKIIRRFCVKSVAWLGIYVLGYYGFSIAWLLTPLLLTVYRQQWKKERDFRLSAARQAALTNEKAMIESRIKVEDLPSWVFFPDKVRSIMDTRLIGLRYINIRLEVLLFTLQNHFRNEQNGSTVLFNNYGQVLATTLEK